jgi:RNA polymerase sigma-70 factor (ECF subfamily)
MLTDLEKIIEQVKNGDQAAFRKIVEEYRQLAFSLAFRIMCDEEEARDVVQESLIKAWQKIETYDIKRKFSSWLGRIVVNTAIDRMRQIKKHNLVSIDRVVALIERLDEGTDQARFENEDLGRMINWIAQGLPEKQKMVFILRDVQGSDSPEVQQILDMSETSVKSNLYHARMAIREKLIKVIK